MLVVEEVSQVTDALLAAVEGLVGQLSASSPPPCRADLDALVRSPATTLLVAREQPAPSGGEEGAIIGMLTVVTFRIPTGMRAWIEDVVVDEAARRRGVGEALTIQAVAVAAAAGARTVDLTSRPSREAANRLYRRLGFQRRETNVYRYQPPAG